jgi:hypothetical protein
MLPEALPYHLKVRDFFRRQTSTWEFFSAAHTRKGHLISFQPELLKNIPQFSREGEPALFGKIDRVREQLELGELPVSVYQAQDSHSGNDLNASVIYLDQEAHLVFSGPILEKLNEEELLAVIAHKLTQVRLYTLLNGDLEVADRIITSIANYRGDGATPYLETARLFKLYTEIYCDRGAYAVLGDPTPVITMLLKPAMGQVSVNAEIRRQALSLWHEQGEDATAAITQMIEGLPDLDRLDLFTQQELSDLTREFLQEYLKPEWMRSTRVIALERQYFPDERTGERTFEKRPVEGPVDPRSASVVCWPDRNPSELRSDSSVHGLAGEDADRDRGRGPVQLQEAIAALHPDIRTWLGYVLLDFAVVDPTLKELPAGRAFEFAAEMQLSDVYDAICKKEWQLNDKKWLQHKQMVQKAYAELPKD